MDIKVIYFICAIAIAVVLLIFIADKKSGNLNKIKAKPIGDGQYGTSRWATIKEITSAFKIIEYQPDLWRKGQNLPKHHGLIISGIWNDDKSHLDDNTDNLIAYNKYRKEKIYKQA